MKIKMTKTEFAILKQVAEDDEVTVFETYRHLYNYLQFAVARSLTETFHKRADKYHKKIRDDIDVFNFRHNLKNLL